VQPQLRGGIVLCEDGGGTQHIRGLNARGELFDFARNLHNTIEFAVDNAIALDLFSIGAR
jgi:hypothetical protein